MCHVVSGGRCTVAWVSSSDTANGSRWPLPSGSAAYTVGRSGPTRRGSLTTLTRDQALDHAKQEASDKAAEAGADPKTIQIVDVEDVPLAYLPGNATRIRVRAVGDLSFAS